MKFNSKEIQEALKNGMKIRPNLLQDVVLFLDQDKLKMTYVSINITAFCNFSYNALMKEDWQIIEEPEYEYLWVVKDTDNSPRRRITMNYYKSKEDANKAMYNVKVLERCEWSKREVSNES